MFLLNLLDLDLQHLHSSISLLWRALQRISARIRVIGGEAVHLLLIRFFFLFFLHKTGFVRRLVLIHAVLRDRAHSTQDIRASAGVQRAHGVLQLGRLADLRSLVQIGRPRRGGWSGSHGSIRVNQRVQWVRFIQRIRWVGANQRVQWVRFVQRIQWVRFVQRIRFVQWVRFVQRVRWVRFVQRIRFVQWVRFIQRIQRVVQVIQWVQIVRSTLQRFIDRIHIVRFSEAVAMIGHQSHFQVRFAFLGRAQLLLHVNQTPKKKNIELLIASLHGLVVLFVVREVLLERIQIVLVVNVRVGLQINKQTSNKQNSRSRSDGFPAPCSSQKAPCSWAWNNNTKQLLVAQRIDLLFQLANVGYHLLVSGGGSLLISSSVL